MSTGGHMERVLRLMAEKGASDIYLSASSPILIKISGQLLQLSDQPLTHAQPRQLLAEMLAPTQPAFTEITLDAREETTTMSGALRPY